MEVIYFTFLLDPFLCGLLLRLGRVVLALGSFMIYAIRFSDNILLAVNKAVFLFRCVRKRRRAARPDASSALISGDLRAPPSFLNFFL